jgi:hypothetical protein
MSSPRKKPVDEFSSTGVTGFCFFVNQPTQPKVTFFVNQSTSLIKIQLPKMPFISPARISLPFVRRWPTRKMHAHPRSVISLLPSAPTLFSLLGPSTVLLSTGFIRFGRCGVFDLKIYAIFMQKHGI